MKTYKDVAASRAHQPEKACYYMFLLEYDKIHIQTMAAFVSLIKPALFIDCMILRRAGISRGDHRPPLDLFYSSTCLPLFINKKINKFNIFIYVFISSANVQLNHSSVGPRNLYFPKCSPKKKACAHTVSTVHMD